MGQVETNQVIALVSPYLGDPVGRIIPTAKGPQIRFHCPFGCERGTSISTGRSRKPSFYLNLSRGVAFCHRCDEGWSLQGLLARIGASRTVRDVAKSLVDEVPDRRAPKVDKHQFVLPEALLGIFHWAPCLLLEAGFDKGVLKACDIGYDRRLNRVTYPIRDYRGRLVGVAGGRTEEEQWPKYLLYGKEELQPLLPETHVPDETMEKSNYLWNFDGVWASAYHGDYDGPVVVVEGYKAALWVVQSGHAATVALMGTYISNRQIDLLLHLQNRIFLFLDNDEAGQRATEKAAWRLRAQGASVHVVEYPRGAEDTQPDDLTAECVRETLERGRRKHYGIRRCVQGLHEGSSTSTQTEEPPDVWGRGATPRSE